LNGAGQIYLEYQDLAGFQMAESVNIYSQDLVIIGRYKKVARWQHPKTQGVIKAEMIEMSTTKLFLPAPKILVASCPECQKQS
jgi:hypothetical protein